MALMLLLLPLFAFQAFVMSCEAAEHLWAAANRAAPVAFEWRALGNGFDEREVVEARCGNVLPAQPWSEPCSANLGARGRKRHSTSASRAVATPGRSEEEDSGSSRARSGTTNLVVLGFGQRGGGGAHLIVR